ncbi:cytochrome C oxidase subunit IV family protein [Ignavibacterium sp.]|uniref:cytochrome C oxidase subunit IV family protein n=1 Tax=Ignavibacterium sp. TaxID=2651167 RepID=UPI00307E5D71
MSNHSENHTQHNHGYGVYILVWLVLMALTGITVAVAGINFGKLTVATALTIASIKTYLVLTIFMHLRSESKTFRVFVGVALLFLLISFVLLFTDYSFIVRN